MALTESNMMELGTQAPAFLLPDTISGKEIALTDVAQEKGTVVLFICNHCPYVIHVMEELVNIAKAYQDQGMGFVAISSNDVINYPDDAPEKMTTFAQEYDFTFPYLYDESQAVAKAYDAACTPDIYVFDGTSNLAYRGRMDGSRPGNNIPVTGEDLRAALDQIIAGQVPEVQIPSAGCNIKWKK
ncbi:MAG: thioredoxin family protein [Bacteroidota bacterium]